MGGSRADPLLPRGSRGAGPARREAFPRKQVAAGLQGPVRTRQAARRLRRTGDMDGLTLSCGATEAEFRDLLAFVKRSRFQGVSDGDLPAVLRDGAGGAGSGYGAILSTMEMVLRRAAKESWSTEELSRHLEGAQASAEQLGAFVAFWAAEQDSIRSFVRQGSAWSGQLRSFRWRVDVQTSSKAQLDVSEPTAIVEFAVRDGVKGKDGPRDDLLRLELSPKQVAALLGKLDDVEAAIAAHVGDAAGAAAQDEV